MRASAALVAYGAVSSLGEGPGAVGAGEARARVAIARDPELEAAGLARPFAARAAAAVAPREERSTALLVRALDACLLELGRGTLDGLRVGVALGTSSGAMRGAEAFFAAHASGARVSPEAARGATYFAPFDEALARLPVVPARAAHLLAACAASTLAVGLGLRWLDLGCCDLVLAGGYDAVSVFVAAGFEAIGATSSSSRVDPFGAERDGLALGEGAAVLALVRPGASPRRARAFVSGFGATTDALHLTAPDETGRELARAAALALDDAGLAASDVGLVGAHATATVRNDAAEAAALASLGLSATVPVHAPKAQLGHALGAAGGLETLALALALERGEAPANAALGRRDPSCAVELPTAPCALAGDAALKLSAAFGGANAALVVTRAPVARPPRAARVAVLAGPAVVRREVPDADELGAALGWGSAAIARLDGLARRALGATHALLAGAAPRLDRSRVAVVVGHALATLETNDAFDRRKRERGAAHVEPRRFPATTPNAVAGQLAIAFGLHGPSLALGAGLRGARDALAVAADLVEARDADVALVVAVDEVGAASRALVEAAGWPDLVDGAAACLVTAGGPGRAVRDALAAVAEADTAVGHVGLAQLVGAVP